MSKCNKKCNEICEKVMSVSGLDGDLAYKWLLSLEPCVDAYIDTINDLDIINDVKDEIRR